MSINTGFFNDPTQFQPYDVAEIDFTPNGVKLVSSEDPATFSGVVNMAVVGDDITKSGGTDTGWDAGCRSIQTIISDGFVDFNAAQTNLGFMLGLSNTFPSVNYTSIQFAIYCLASGVIQIYESGNFIGSFGTYTILDNLRVKVESSVVIYIKNGVVLYTSLITPTLPLFMACSFLNIGASAQNIFISNSLTVYPTNSPSIFRTVPLFVTSVTSFAMTATVPVNTQLYWVLIVNGLPYWWNGTAWVTSNQTIGQANTAAQINSNISSFDFSAGYQFEFQTFLTSTDGVNTPFLASRTVNITTFLPKPPEPPQVHLQGYVEDLLGFTPPNFVLTANAFGTVFNGSAFVLSGGVSFRATVIGATGAFGSSTAASGYLDFYLNETQTTGQLIQFAANYTKEGIFRETLFLPVIIPNQIQINLSDLLVPINS